MCMLASVNLFCAQPLITWDTWRSIASSRSRILQHCVMKSLHYESWKGLHPINCLQPPFQAPNPYTTIGLCWALCSWWQTAGYNSYSHETNWVIEMPRPLAGYNYDENELIEAKIELALWCPVHNGESTATWLISPPSAAVASESSQLACTTVVNPFTLPIQAQPRGSVFFFGGGDFITPAHEEVSPPPPPRVLCLALWSNGRLALHQCVQTGADASRRATRLFPLYSCTTKNCMQNVMLTTRDFKEFKSGDDKLATGWRLLQDVRNHVASYSTH